MHSSSLLFSANNTTTIFFGKNLLKACLSGVKVPLFYNFSNKAKGLISKRRYQETKTHQIFRKTNIFCPLETLTKVCVSGGKKCSFFEKFGVLCFIETPVLRLAFLLYCRRTMQHFSIGWTRHIYSSTWFVVCELPHEFPKNLKLTFLANYNPGHNILELYNTLVQIRFTTIKRKLDI